MILSGIKGALVVEGKRDCSGLLSIVAAFGNFTDLAAKEELPTSFAKFSWRERRVVGVIAIVSILGSDWSNRENSIEARQDKSPGKSVVY